MSAFKWALHFDKKALCVATNLCDSGMWWQCSSQCQNSIKACGSTSYNVVLVGDMQQVLSCWWIRYLVVDELDCERVCLQQHSLLGLAVSRISLYTIPFAYGGINSVPLILIISMVRLDIQIKRSILMKATRQCPQAPSLRTLQQSKPCPQRPPLGFYVSKKEKRGGIFQPSAPSWRPSHDSPFWSNPWTFMPLMFSMLHANDDPCKTQ
jgi:hypothetical protein